MIYKDYEPENDRNVRVYNLCPACKNENTYQRFVNIQTQVQVANDVGKCNNKSCRYLYTPWAYLKKNNLDTINNVPPSFIPHGHFERSLGNNKENNLFLYLSKHFEEYEVIKAMDRYSVGTVTKNYPGAAILWRIDNKDNKRTGKICLIDKESGEDISRLNYGKQWIHRLVNMPRFNFVNCLFGEHLLKDNPDMPLVIVYSEITAIIGSIVYPSYLWLAMPTGFHAPDVNTINMVSGRKVTWFSLTHFKDVLFYTNYL